MKNCLVRVLVIEAAAQRRVLDRYILFLTTLFALVLVLCLFERFRRGGVTVMVEKKFLIS